MSLANSLSRLWTNVLSKVKSLQRSGTGAIRTKIQPSKPKREITRLQIVKIQREHMVNRVSSYIQKGGHSATESFIMIFSWAFHNIKIRSVIFCCSVWQPCQKLRQICPRRKATLCTQGSERNDRIRKSESGYRSARRLQIRNATSRRRRVARNRGDGSVPCTEYR